MFPCSFSYTVFGGGGLEETLQEKMVKGVICAVLLWFGNSNSQSDPSRQFFLASEWSVTLQNSLELSICKALCSQSLIWPPYPTEKLCSFSRLNGQISEWPKDTKQFRFYISFLSPSPNNVNTPILSPCRRVLTPRSSRGRHCRLMPVTCSQQAPLCRVPSRPAMTMPTMWLGHWHSRSENELGCAHRGRRAPRKSQWLEA